MKRLLTGLTVGRMLISGLVGLLIVGLSGSPSWAQWWPWWNQAVASPAPPVCPTYGSAVALGLLGGGDTQGYAYFAVLLAEELIR